VRVDIAIIGTGPGGVSAAITSKVRNKSILLFGESTLSSKIEKASSILNYPGMPNTSGASLSSAFREHLQALDIIVTEDKVKAVYAMGDYFSIQGASQMYEATSVIIATGANVTKPYEGELEFLGRGVSYCATCDAALYKDREAIVVATSNKEEDEVRFLAEVASKVYYVPTYKGEIDMPPNVEIVEGKPQKILGQLKADTLVLDTKELKAFGIFILRESIAADKLVPGIKFENNSIWVDKNMATSIAGCFACGDVTGKPYQYIKAAGEGNVAALSAVSYVDNIKRNK